MEVSLGAGASSGTTTGSGLHVTAWSPAAEARHLDEGAEAAGAELVWCDLRHATAGDGLEASLLALCPGLTAAMLADLLTPDRLPEGRSYGDGSIRLASTCALHFESSGEESAAAGNAIAIQPVELLASHEWLITNWHPARRISSAGETTDVGQVVDPEQCCQAVARRWRSGCGTTAGDLGLLLMHELALTYGPTQRDISSVLEDWELRLYDGETTSEQLAIQRESLRRLWQLRAVMRDWIAPLNLPGLGLDVEKVWLPCTNHAEAKAVDDRIDRELENLAELGEALRSSFHLIHLEEVERERERREQMQRRIEVIAAIFLIPTFIFGLYGANTWLPGQGREWGFAAMLAVMVLFTLVGVLLLDRWHKQRAPSPGVPDRAEPALGLGTSRRGRV